MVDLKGLKFAKMHGIGNDFPIIDESREQTSRKPADSYAIETLE